MQMELFHYHEDLSTLTCMIEYGPWTSPGLPEPLLLAYISSHSCAISAWISMFNYQSNTDPFLTTNYVGKYDETRETFAFTCKVPPPPVLPQSSETLTMVHGSDAFQWKSTTLSLHARQQNGSEMGIYQIILPYTIFIRGKRIRQSLYITWNAQIAIDMYLPNYCLICFYNWNKQGNSGPAKSCFFFW